MRSAARTASAMVQPVRSGSSVGSCRLPQCHSTAGNSRLNADRSGPATCCWAWVNQIRADVPNALVAIWRTEVTVAMDQPAADGRGQSVLWSLPIRVFLLSIQDDQFVVGGWR